jgi:hypothetical protein
MTCGIGPTLKSTSPTVVIVFNVLIDFAKLRTTSTPLQREDATNAAAPPIRPRETLLRYVL